MRFKGICLGGPLHGQEQESDNYIIEIPVFPDLTARAAMVEASTARIEFDRIVYKWAQYSGLFNFWVNPNESEEEWSAHLDRLLEDRAFQEDRAVPESLPVLIIIGLDVGMPNDEHRQPQIGDDEIEAWDEILDQARSSKPNRNQKSP